MTNTLSTSISTGITLTTGGNYQSPFTITSTGTVAPPASAIAGGAGVTGVLLGYAGFISNSGVIFGGGGGYANTYGHFGGIGGAGVLLASGGSFNNSGTIIGGRGGGYLASDSSGPGGHGGDGVDLYGAGSFDNNGSISGGIGGGGDYGMGGAGVSIIQGYFSNNGIITGGNGAYSATGGGASGGTGANLSDGGVLNNRGTIRGGSHGGPNPSNPGGIGISLSGGTLVNSGLIAGTFGAEAVQFGTNTSTLIVESGATFTGNVVANSAVSDVLAIGGSAPVTISNIGAEYQNFHTLAFEGGAFGAFVGSLAGDSIIGFVRGDSLYLNGFIAESTIATIGAGGTLAIAGNNGQTLNLTFASAAIGDVLDFTNSANGTGITFDPHFLNQSISNGITLTATGTYQSPFTITSAGAVTPGTSGGNGASGVYGAVSGQILRNYGYVRGWGGSSGFNVPPFTPGLVDTNGSLGGAGVDLVGGSIINAGTIVGGGGGGAYGLSAQQGGLGGAGGAGVILSGAATLTNSGTIFGGLGGPNLNNNQVYDGVGGAGISVNGGVIVDSGLIEGGFSVSGTRSNAVQFGTKASTLIVEHGATFTGNVVANSTVSDVLAIGGSAPVYLSGIGAKYQNFSTLAFETGATGTASGTYTAMDALTISGFAQGDTLVLDGFAATSDTYLSGHGLELSNGTSQITINITGNFTTANFNVIDPPANTTISLNPPCFAQGTRILTTRGEIPVEQLRTGDHLILHSGGTAPIQWIGHRSLAPSRHPNPKQINPIRITAGALQNNIPHRDLVLSPDHALYLNGTLIPAKSLLNGTTIRQESRRSVTYYHIELAHHAVLYAEGTPAESYLETGNRHAFSNGGSALTLHPDFAQTLREQTGCAPFAESGPIVEKTRAQILARTNQHLTNNPGLTLHTNQDGSVTIHSRSGIPGYLSPDPRDQRTLGVKILSLRTGAQKIPLDHPLLTEGWHTPEPDGRWTNGRGIIPASLAKSGPITLELAATTQYPAPQSTRQRA